MSRLGHLTERLARAVIPERWLGRRPIDANELEETKRTVARAHRAVNEWEASASQMKAALHFERIWHERFPGDRG